MHCSVPPPTSPTLEAASAASEHANAQTMQDAQKEHKRISEACKHRTFGNKVVDWLFYGSTAYAGVATMSALSAHEALHGTNPWFNWLRTIKTKTSDGLTSALSKTLLKHQPLENARAWGNGSALFLMLGLGGCTLMWPLKIMEDNRQKISAKIDNFFGTTPPDPTLVAHEPKQDWTSVLSGRAFSWGTSYAAYVAMGPQRANRIGNWFGEKFTNGFMKLRPNANQVKVREWADIAAFDFVFTVITATLTYIGSRFVARKRDHYEENTVVQQSPSQEFTQPQVAETTENKEKSFISNNIRIDPAQKSAPASARITKRVPITLPQKDYTQKVTMNEPAIQSIG